MRIYQNIGGDEVDIISDGYKMVQPEGFEGVVTEVQSRMVAKAGGDDIDIGCGNAFGGKNEDDEEGGAAVAAPVEKINDLIDAFQYGESGMDKDSFKTWLKEYGKKVIPKLQGEEAQARFKKGFQAFAKTVLGKFADFTIYCPQNWDMDNTLIFSFWKNESDPAPVFWYLLDGLKSMKV